MKRFLENSGKEQLDSVKNTGRVSIMRRMLVGGIVMMLLVITGLLLYANRRTDGQGRDDRINDNPYEGTDINGNVMDSHMNSVVRVKSSNLFGSGVILRINDAEIIVITAAHVVETDPVRSVIEFGDKELSAVDCRVMEDSDLAFLKVAVDGMTAADIETIMKEVVPISIDKDAFDAMVYDNDLELVGYVGNAQLRYEAKVEENWIYSEDFAQYMMLLRGHGDPGMSGGAALDQNGNLMGIICGGTYDLDGVEYVAVLPLSLILAAEMSLGW